MSFPLSETLQDVLARQSGVISRRPLWQQGFVPTTYAESSGAVSGPASSWGVVDHTGPPARVQRAWAELLCCWPAVLSGPSAIRVAQGCSANDDRLPISVAIARHRSSPVEVPGVVVRHATDLDTRALWHTAPPRLRYEEAVRARLSDRPLSAADHCR
jgi:hypothetical protein